MIAPNTRLDTAILRPDVESLAATLDVLDATLVTNLVALSADERARMPRVRTGLPAAARVLANVLATRPAIGAAAGYEAAAVVEDLDNVELIAPLVPRLKALVQRLEDSLLQWNAEAQEQTFALYAVAKVRAERDGGLADLIEPLQRVLANGPRSKV